MDINNHGYMILGIWLNGKTINISEHRLNALINNSLKDVLENHVHHRNHCKFDNSVENLELMSASEHHILHNAGKEVSFETRQKLSEVRTGKTHSLETRRKISEILKGREFSIETCRKISEAKIGKKSNNFNPCILIRREKNKTCKQGFVWIARPYTKDGKRLLLSSVDLEKCKQKVEEFLKSEENTLGYTSYEAKLE